MICNMRIFWISGKIDELRKKHAVEMADFEKAQTMNKARTTQGLQEKLQARRSRRSRMQNHEREIEAMQSAWRNRHRYSIAIETIGNHNISRYIFRGIVQISDGLTLAVIHNTVLNGNWHRGRVVLLKKRWNYNSTSFEPFFTLEKQSGNAYCLRLLNIRGIRSSSLIYFSL